MKTPVGEPVLVCRLTKGWRATFAITFAASALVCAGGPITWLVRQPIWSVWQIALLTVGLGLAGLSIYGITKIGRHALLIWPDLIRKQGAWKGTDIPLDDIEGYRFATQGTPGSVVLKRRGTWRFKQLELIYDQRAEFFRFLEARLPNLDVQTFETEMAEIKRDETLGFSEEQRLAKLATARTWCRGVNAIAMIVGFWAFLYPNPYGWAVGLAAAMPLLALLPIVLFPKVVRFDAKKGAAHPTVATAFLLPPMMLLLRAVLDWKILSYENLWLPLLVAGFALFALAVAVARDLRKNKVTMVIALVWSFVHAFGLVLYANCYHDRSVPAEHRAQVTERHINSGKVTTYTLVVSPSVNDEPTLSIDVPRVVYEQHPVGDTVRLYVRSGALGMPWVFLR